MNIISPFDAELEAAYPFNYLPWIGKDFGNTKIQIIGDSHYDDGDDWLPNNKYATRQLINNNGLNSHKPEFAKAHFLRAVERIVSNRQLKIEERATFWNRVSFLNLSQRLMSSIKERPTDSDFDEGWHSFLKLAAITKPGIVIKLGIDGIGRLGYYLNNNETEWDRTVAEFYKKPFVINLRNKDYSFKLAVINHPTGSWGFDEPKWTSHLHKEFSQLQTLLN